MFRTACVLVTLAMMAVPVGSAASPRDVPVLLEAGPVDGPIDGALRARGSMPFDTGSYAPSDGDRERLRRVAAVIRARKDVVVYLVGRADVRGPADENRALSLRRCHAVAAYLERWGVPFERIVVLAAGETHSTRGRHVPGAWALDRRVELRFVVRRARARTDA